MKKTKVYQLGFKHGYEQGLEKNPYINWLTDEEHKKYLEYISGYNDGVSKYCAEEL